MTFDSIKVDNVDRLTASDWNAMVTYLKGKGNKVIAQTTAPSVSVDGEYWFDTTPDSNKLKLKVSGAWVDLTLTGPKGDTGAAGTNGTNGTDGKTIRYGTVAPTTEGVDGDFYIDIVTHTVYGPKATTWPAGTSMIGPQGETGASGSGSGDVIGPSSATDNAIARFDSTTGKLLQNSLVTIDDSGSVSIPSGQTYKINGVSLTATDVNAASSTHDHNSTYLGIAAKAADSDALDGHDTAYFEPAITTLPISKGGTGITTAPGDGKLLIGKTDGSYASANLTAGPNVTITNADGAITIAASGGSGSGVSRLAAIASTISILTSDAAAGKSGTIDLTATTGQIARIRLRADFLAGQQANPGTFQVNNASGISATATSIAYDSASAGMVLATGGGDIVQIDGEKILTATGTTTTAIAVATRGYNGTVATYHDDNAVGFKCSDGLRLELYPNSNYLPTERLLTLRGLMTGQWAIGAAGVANGASFIPLTTSPVVLSDFGMGSLIAILDTATDYARVQDVYGLVADSGTVNSIRTQTTRPAHAASTVVQRVLEYDLPIPFAFSSGTSLYYKLFVDEKYTATVTVNVELIVDKYT